MSDQTMIERVERAIDGAFTGLLKFNSYHPETVETCRRALRNAAKAAIDVMCEEKAFWDDRDIPVLSVIQSAPDGARTLTHDEIVAAVRQVFAEREKARSW